MYLPKNDIIKSIFPLPSSTDNFKFGTIDGIDIRYEAPRGDCCFDLAIYK